MQTSWYHRLFFKKQKQFSSDISLTFEYQISILWISINYSPFLEEEEKKNMYPFCDYQYRTFKQKIIDDQTFTFTKDPFQNKLLDDERSTLSSLLNVITCYLSSVV